MFSLTTRRRPKNLSAPSEGLETEGAARAPGLGVEEGLSGPPRFAGPLPRRLGGRLVAGLGAVLAAGCSPVTVLNELAPERLAEEGLAYGPLPRQRLDLYRPAKATQPAPVVLFIYGGNWDAGDRAMYRFVGAALAARGCLVAVADYRLYPEVRFPTFLEDCALAARFTRDHAAEWGGDPGRFFLMGHSAGAYNAVMLALDRQWLGAVGMVPERDLAGVIGIAGPYDFLPLESAMLKDLFGPEDERARTQPINFVDGRNPPLLLLHGDTDSTVLPRNTINLAARIQKAGGPVEQRIYRNIGHQVIAGALSGTLRFLAPTLADSLAFIGPLSSEG